MNIMTWNVNGFRAIMKKDGFDWLKAINPDVLCLQEIKVKPDQLTEQEQKLADYSVVWNSAERPGYSGTAIFYKSEPNDFELGFGRQDFDNEGRVIRFKYPDFYLYNIYFPNGGEENQRVSYKLAFYEYLLTIIDDIHKAGKNVIITGDFNTAHNEIDLKNPKANEKNTGFLPEERKWIDIYLDHGLVDVYRKLYPDTIGYTWWTYRMNARARNVGWRLDYFLISENLMPRVNGVVIYDEIMGSDHCPVSLLLND